MKAAFALRAETISEPDVSVSDERAAENLLEVETDVGVNKMEVNNESDVNAKKSDVEKLGTLAVSGWYPTTPVAESGNVLLAHIGALLNEQSKKADLKSEKTD